MKIYKTEGLCEECSICGHDNGSPVKIARTSTDSVLKREVLHYHRTGHEYYIFISGRARMRVEERVMDVGRGDMVYVQPGEKHCILEVTEPADYIVINNNPDPSDKIIVET